MMGRQYLAILGKDLLVEFRTREILLTMALFSMLLVIIFAFAFLSDPTKAKDYGPGIIWVTVLFSATIGQNRLFDRERENGCLWGLLLSPVDAGTIFLAKATAQFIFTLLMELPTILLIILFFDLPLVQPMEFITSLLLGTVALSLVGTLFSAMLMNARMKEVLLPLVTYPLLVPVVIAGVKVTSVAVGAPVNEDAWMWLKFLLGFDMIFAVATWFLFGRMIRA
ncbi:MAG TPA: heme exporter protein CcmB [Myxococcota bacterium]|nr:heme exporter protein CcmB [Myxococcota bacterium]HOS62500.1 heme exporter protein CcmB [Myxococcota bacterium]HPC92243.1 heme exporter protein CcmB [Myxococcota bacterium]HPL25642.1 heme exporter protein CcmB [Myxococcota bacterium]HQE74072.1 heme exporter protein CcmB [Myxococcota bacterium]